MSLIEAVCRGSLKIQACQNHDGSVELRLVVEAYVSVVILPSCKGILSDGKKQFFSTKPVQWNFFLSQLKHAETLLLSNCDLFSNVRVHFILWQSKPFPLTKRLVILGGL